MLCDIVETVTSYLLLMLWKRHAVTAVTSYWLQVDEFELEAVDLSELTSLTVGHDGRGIGAGWYLNKILIKESSDATKVYVFQCDKWVTTITWITKYVLFSSYPIYSILCNQHSNSWILFLPDYDIVLTGGWTRVRMTKLSSANLRWLRFKSLTTSRCGPLSWRRRHRKWRTMTTGA